MGKFIDYLFNKALDFVESHPNFFKGPVVLWMLIWLVMVPAWNILWFWITYIKDLDSSWSFLWGVLFYILGAIVVLVGVFIVNAVAKHIGLDDK